MSPGETDKSASWRVISERTRRQLEELDALLERMLALPPFDLPEQNLTDSATAESSCDRYQPAQSPAKETSEKANLPRPNTAREGSSLPDQYGENVSAAHRASHAVPGGEVVAMGTTLEHCKSGNVSQTDRPTLQEANASQNLGQPTTTAPTISSSSAASRVSVGTAQASASADDTGKAHLSLSTQGTPASSSRPLAAQTSAAAEKGVPTFSGQSEAEISQSSKLERVAGRSADPHPPNAPVYGTTVGGAQTRVSAVPETTGTSEGNVARESASGPEKQSDTGDNNPCLTTRCQTVAPTFEAKRQASEPPKDMARGQQGEVQDLPKGPAWLLREDPVGGKAEGTERVSAPPDGRTSQPTNIADQKNSKGQFAWLARVPVWTWRTLNWVFTSPTGSNLLGWIGIVLLLGSAAFWLGAWFGWHW